MVICGGFHSREIESSPFHTGGNLWLIKIPSETELATVCLQWCVQLLKVQVPCFHSETFLSSLKGALHVPSTAAEGCALPRWHNAVYHTLPADAWYGRAEHGTAHPSQPGAHELVHGPKRRDKILSRQVANQCSLLFSIVFFSYCVIADKATLIGGNHLPDTNSTFRVVIHSFPTLGNPGFHVLVPFPVSHLSSQQK